MKKFIIVFVAVILVAFPLIGCKDKDIERALKLMDAAKTTLVTFQAQATDICALEGMDSEKCHEIQTGLNAVITSKKKLDEYVKEFADIGKALDGPYYKQYNLGFINDVAHLSKLLDAYYIEKEGTD